MKKIPVIFEMEYENHKGRAINKIRSGFENILENGIATLKYDGSACAIFNNELYKRYDAKTVSLFLMELLNVRKSRTQLQVICLVGLDVTETILKINGSLLLTIIQII